MVTHVIQGIFKENRQLMVLQIGGVFNVIRPYIKSFAINHDDFGSIQEARPWSADQFAFCQLVHGPVCKVVDIMASSYIHSSYK